MQVFITLPLHINHSRSASQPCHPSLVLLPCQSEWPWQCWWPSCRWDSGLPSLFSSIPSTWSGACNQTGSDSGSLCNRLCKLYLPPHSPLPATFGAVFSRSHILSPVLSMFSSDPCRWNSPANWRGLRKVWPLFLQYWPRIRIARSEHCWTQPRGPPDAAHHQSALSIQSKHHWGYRWRSGGCRQRVLRLRVAGWWGFICYDLRKLAFEWSQICTRNSSIFPPRIFWGCHFKTIRISYWYGTHRLQCKGCHISSAFSHSCPRSSTTSCRKGAKKTVSYWAAGRQRHRMAIPGRTDCNE